MQKSEIKLFKKRIHDLLESESQSLLRPYYQKLLAYGKPKKVARCAVARKLIHIAWACVTKQRNFDPNFVHKSKLLEFIPSPSGKRVFVKLYLAMLNKL